MKVRTGFVSNSSSSSFVITNKTDEKMSLIDFVMENPALVEMWNSEYDREDTQDDMIANATERDNSIEPGEQVMFFGDEDGDVLGRVFDYILRDGGDSENFSWEFNDSHR